MASTAPAKSQPLHNFDLPLKWNKDSNSSGHHHRRRLMKSPSGRTYTSSPSPLRHSPLRDISVPPPSSSRESADSSVKQSPYFGDFSCRSIGVREGVRQLPIGGDSVKWSPSSARGDLGRFLPRHESESEGSGRSKGIMVEHRRSYSKNSLNSEGGAEKFEKKLKAGEGNVLGVKRSSKIKIKIPHKNTKLEEESLPEETEKLEQSHANDETDEVQEDGKINNNSVDEESKTWNLRPRKPNRKSLNLNGGGSTLKSNGLAMPEKSKVQSPSRNGNNKTGEKESIGAAGEKKEKRKQQLSIHVSLTKEEIEDDIFAWTGSKPSRRPKKRAKSIQKQLDFVFPGLWLVSITPDSYKVSENSMKG